MISKTIVITGGSSGIGAAAARKLRAKYPRIDVLANNAGAVIATRQITEDGHEKTLQVNHLGGFLLTLVLRERLEASHAISPTSRMNAITNRGARTARRS